jgi:hypothetical protein
MKCGVGVIHVDVHKVLMNGWAVCEFHSKLVDYGFRG